MSNILTHESSEVLLKKMESRMGVLIHAGAMADREDVSETVTAASHHLGSGGQRVRARLALHAGSALGLEANDVLSIATTVELLHNASLVHDDLQDRELLRRGMKTIWSAYGDNVALCVGDLMISAAYGSLCSFGILQYLPDLITLVHERTAMVIRGQCCELSAKGHRVNDFAFYEKIAIAKSGSLISLPLEMAFLGSGMKPWIEKARSAAEDFAIGYQIADDIEDLERDAGDGDGPRSVNALLVLEAGGHGKNAPAIAREFGLRRLRSSAEAAERLPNGSGSYLRDISLALCARL